MPDYETVQIPWTTKMETCPAYAMPEYETVQLPCTTEMETCLAYGVLKRP